MPDAHRLRPFKRERLLAIFPPPLMPSMPSMCLPRTVSAANLHSQGTAYSAAGTSPLQPTLHQGPGKLKPPLWVRGLRERVSNRICCDEESSAAYTADLDPDVNVSDLIWSIL